MEPEVEYVTDGPYHLTNFKVFSIRFTIFSIFLYLGCIFAWYLVFLWQTIVEHWS